MASEKVPLTVTCTESPDDGAPTVHVRLPDGTAVDLSPADALGLWQLIGEIILPKDLPMVQALAILERFVEFAESSLDDEFPN